MVVKTRSSTTLGITVYVYILQGSMNGKCLWSLRTWVRKWENKELYTCTGTPKTIVYIHTAFFNFIFC